MLFRLSLVVLLCCVATILFAQEHKPENDKNPFAGNPAAVTAGAKLYEQACQTCHGGEGRGGDRAPALAGATFKHGKLDGEIFLNIRNGILGTQMPGFKRLSSDQVWQLVSYVRSLNAVATNTNEKTLGNMAVGESLFFGKANCAACHEISARGANVGPDLSNAGRFAADLLQQKILDPTTNMNLTERRRRRGGDGSRIVIVTTKAGQTVRGLVRNEDTYTMLLTDVTGKLHRFEKNNVEVNYEMGSLMPTDYGKQLSDGELQNLVAYLKTCNGRDFAQTSNADIAGGLTYDRIRNSSAEPNNWLTYWGDYSGKHFSSLKEINTTNVSQLQARWAVQMPGDSMLEATPLVVDGVMYTSGMPGQVFALDAKSGLQIWKYERKQKVVNPYESNRFNRGVAVLGNRVFFGTLDAALIALDARTGQPLWEVQVADTMEGYSITSPPLVVKDKIIVGVAGGEYGIRGFLDCYDAKTGKRLWRFNSTPGKGEFGNETWKGETWKLGGGATWLTGSYDPELDTVYWTFGNPSPDMDAEIRKGDNLFTCSVVAFDPNTGTRKWHYQFTPNDDHDWDANQDVILVDRVWEGQPRKLLIQANRNGFLYVLDRTNGKFLSGKPYVKQTWNAGFDETGRPKFLPKSNASPEGNEVFPSLVGGTNWQSPSYDTSSNLLYLTFAESGNRFVRSEMKYEPGKGYWGGRTLPASGESYAGIRAIDTTTGERKWEHKISQGSLAAGVMASSGGVVFAATREGNFIVLDAKTGKSLWRFQTGGTIASAPISYAVDGKQFIALAAGGVMYSFALPEIRE